FGPRRSSRRSTCAARSTARPRRTGTSAGRTSTCRGSGPTRHRRSPPTPACPSRRRSRSDRGRVRVSRRPSRRRAGGLLLTALIAAGCGTAPAPSGVTPSAGASGSPGTSSPAATPEPTTHEVAFDWGKADVVDAPHGDATETTPPYINPGSLGHPQAYQGGQADLLDVALTS